MCKKVQIFFQVLKNAAWILITASLKVNCDWSEGASSSRRKIFVVFTRSTSSGSQSVSQCRKLKVLLKLCVLIYTN